MSELREGKREREKAGEGISIGRSAYIRSESSSPSVASSATRCSVSDTCHSASVSLEITRSIFLPSFVRETQRRVFTKGKGLI